MVIAEVKNGFATVRIHDGSCRTETRQTMAEVSRIVSQAYQRRVSAAAAARLEDTSI